MNREDVGALLSIVLTLSIAIGAGVYIGTSAGYSNCQTEAIQADAAKWTINEKTGKTNFV